MRQKEGGRKEAGDNAKVEDIKRRPQHGPCAVGHEAARPSDIQAPVPRAFVVQVLPNHSEGLLNPQATGKRQKAA